eukprot:1841225-Amphidinium_carterae.1
MQAWSLARQPSRAIEAPVRATGGVTNWPHCKKTMHIINHCSPGHAIISLSASPQGPTNAHKQE